jgi:hypothetical protein
MSKHSSTSSASLYDSGVLEVGRAANAVLCLWKSSKNLRGGLKPDITATGGPLLFKGTTIVKC